MKSPENLKNNYKDDLNGALDKASKSTDSFLIDQKKTVQEGIDSAIEMYKDEDIIRKSKETALDLASGSLSLIKKHPYYVALGASAIGIAIGYFVLRSRSKN